MKKIVRNILALVLVLAMTCSMLACSSSTEEEKTETSKTEQETAKPTQKPVTDLSETTKVETENAITKDDIAKTDEEKYAEHMTYSYASIQITESTDYNSPDDAMTQYWTQKYNFDWDIISISSDNWDQTVNTWVYAEDLPDITIFDYKHAQMLDWIDQGLVREFPSDWATRWPNVYNSQVNAGIGLTVAEQVGGTYFLARPNYAANKPNRPEFCPTNMMLYIRKDWAQAVGFELKEYYTIDELMEYARLVKEQDPGNVGSALVPMGLKSDNCYNVFVGTESTFTASNAYFYRDTDGVIKWGLRDEDTCEGLELWKKAYEEGLLNKEFYSYSGSEDVEDFYVRGVSGLMWYQGGARYQQNVANYMRDNLGLEYDDAVWQCFAISNDGTYHWAPGGNFWGVIMFNPDMSDEKFERYMDMLDESASNDGQVLIRMGFQGEDWEYQNGEMVSLIPNGKDARSKYPSIYPVYHQLLVLSDDFVLINPNYPAEYRQRTIDMYHLKEQLSTPTSCPGIDYDIYLYSSEALNALSFEFGSDFANIVVNKSNVREGWEEWLDSWAYMVDPALEEMNANIK